MDEKEIMVHFANNSPARAECDRNRCRGMKGSATGKKSTLLRWRKVEM
ncbi:hypothetical protein ACFLTR_03170 [Chloroflexota bacterium]